jgi:phosphoglycolate phosphatase-like HAD superfamily hydrolase
MNLRVALFDVDGVLLDSLRLHLKICRDKSREYGLGLKIPSAREFKKLVRSGVPISPMKCFFLAVGFPEEYADKANRQYQDVFMRLYAPRPFPGVHRVLQALHDSGLQLGIVTSNVRANVVGALGPSMKFFHPDCVLTGDKARNSSKAELIVTALKILDANPAEAVYVGDQPADWEAAKAAQVNFLGATYGWGISEDDQEFPLVNRVSDIYLRVTEL